MLTGDTWSLYGRSFTLTEQSQLLLLMVYVLMGAIFLLSVFLPQSAIFVPVSLAVLSPLSGALMVQPFVVGAVLLLIAAGALAVLIQGSRAGSTLAALRYLTLAALAMPLLLSAGWMLESDQFQFLNNVTLLILVAILLLTTSFPFQVWVAPVVGESTSLAPAVVFGVGQLLVVVFCLNLLIEQPFVYGNAQFQAVVSGSAAATLILAGLLAMTARSFGHLLGYLLLISIGAVGAVLASGGSGVVSVTLTLLILRIISLVVAGSGLAMVRVRTLSVEGGANQFEANRGLAWRAPIGMGLFVLGCLSLAGLPLTPGFAGTWPAVILIGEQSPWLAIILVLAIAAGAFGLLRRLIPLLARTDQESDLGAIMPESRSEKIVAVIILTLGAILAIFPQFIYTFSESLANLF
jgi:NADH:ubiquinone oxidoreductase subunit 2 (subunit N)